MFAGFLLGFLSVLFAPKQLKFFVITLWAFGLCLVGLTNYVAGI